MTLASSRKVILADGTEKTVTVDKDSKSAARGSGDGAIAAGDLVKYASINDSNVMDLDSVIYKNTVGKNGDGSTVYDKDTKTFDGVMTDSDAVLFVKTAGGDYYAYNLRSLNNIKVSAGTKNFYSVKNNDGKVEAAVVELDGKPSGATADTVYGIVTDKAGIEKINDDYQMVYTVANNEGEYTVYMPTSATLEEGDIVYFDQSADKTYSNTDVTKITTGLYAKELDKDKVLSYYTSVTKTADGYVGNGLQNVALDSDAKIVYVDQDNDKAGTDIGVTEFDKINGYANIAIVKGSDGKIDAIIVESSNETDIANASKATLSAEFTAAASESSTLTVTNVQALTGTLTVAVKNAAGTAVTMDTATAATYSNGTLTITLKETATSLPAGTYTVAVTDQAAKPVTVTYSFNVAK